ncbi:hypothetical protein IAT38_006479 [Cryptococcus sp. DSM 104549]
MPIPPRPIPTRPTQRQRAPRPGSSVPRKSLPTTQQHLDWRAEVALLGEVGARSVPGRLGGLRGGKGVSPVGSPGGSPGGGEAHGQGQGQGQDDGVKGRREVGLEGLIADGRGKREKRTTTATTLGFDFIPNPSVLALPDDPTPAPTGTPKGKGTSSLLTASKSTPSSATRAATPNLAGTPTTPALLASPSSGSETEPESDSGADEFDDWEHIPSVSVSSHGERGRDENVDSDGEEDVIVLGEMDLEEEVESLGVGVERVALETTVVKGKEGKAGKADKGKRGKGKSYAAVALGA